MNTKHTPTPWSYDKAFRVLRGKERGEVAYSLTCTDEDAAFIVRAVNAHEELVAALKIALRDHKQNDPHHSDLCDLCQMMTQAIAKAEGK